MTYNVFGGTLNLAQSINQFRMFMAPPTISRRRLSVYGLSVSACVRDNIPKVCDLKKHLWKFHA